MSAAAVQLDAIAQEILNKDNDVRRAAEQRYYAFCDADPSFFLQTLLEVVSTPSASLHGRFFCAEMLRQNLASESKIWANVSEEARIATRDSLSTVFSHESDPRIRRRVTYAMAALAQRLSKDADLAESWPGLIAHTLAGCAHDDVSVREGCFELLGRIGESTVRAFAPALAEITAALLAGMQDTTLTVALKALHAVACTALGVARLVLTANDAGADAEHDAAFAAASQAALASVVPAACQVLVNALNTDNDDRISDALDALKELSRANPEPYFHQCLDALVPVLAQAANAESLEGEVRRSALMMLVSLSGGQRGKEMVRKASVWYEAVLSISFQWLQDLQVVQQWRDDPAFDDELVNPFHHSAQYALSTLPVTLGSSLFTKLVMGPCTQLLAQPEWQAQNTALIGLLSIVEKGWKFGAKHLLTFDVTPYLAADRHERVRFTALGLAGNIAEHSSKWTSNSLPTLIPAFVACMDPAHNPVRLICIACSYLINLLSRAEPVALAQHLLSLFTALTQLLGHDSGDIRMAALGSLSAVSIAAGSDVFAAYYRQIMDGLLDLADATLARLGTGAAAEAQTQERQLAGKVCETIGFVSSAAGHDFVLPDAPRAVGCVARVQHLEASFSDGSQGLPTQAIKSLAGVLGGDFAPYLETVLDPLLQAAGVGDVYASFDLDTDDRVMAHDADRAAHYSEQNGYTLLDLRRQDGAGKRRIAVHTARVQEKIAACEMICQFANELKDAFGPFVSKSAEILIPLCSFRFHPMVRAAALASVPALFNAAKAVVGRTHGVPEQAHEGLTYVHLWPAEAAEQLQGTWDMCLTALLDAAQTETVSNFASLMLAASATLDHVPLKVSAHSLGELATMTVSMTTESMRDRAEFTATLNAAEANETDDDTIAEASSSLSLSNTNLDAASVLIASIARNAGPENWPAVAEIVMPLAQQLLSAAADDDPQPVCSGLIMVASAVRFGLVGAEQASVAESILPLALAHSRAALHALRRASADALRTIIAALPAAAFAPHVGAALETLVPAMGITEPDEDEAEDCEYATDNVVSAVVVVLEKFAFCEQPTLPDAAVEQICAAWLHVMPRTHDEDVCPDINHFFMRCVTEGRSAVVGANNSNVHRVLDIMAAALDAEREEDTVVVRDSDIPQMKGYWQHVKESIGATEAQRLFASLDEDCRDALEA
jgi:hypothetical protein